MWIMMMMMFFFLRRQDKTRYLNNLRPITFMIYYQCLPAAVHPRGLPRAIQLE